MICPRCKTEMIESSEKFICTNCNIEKFKKMKISDEVMKEFEIIKETEKRIKNRFNAKRKMIIKDENGNIIDEYEI